MALTRQQVMQQHREINRVEVERGKEIISNLKIGNRVKLKMTGHGYFVDGKEYDACYEGLCDEPKILNNFDNTKEDNPLALFCCRGMINEPLFHDPNAIFSYRIRFREIIVGKFGKNRKFIVADIDDRRDSTFYYQRAVARTIAFSRERNQSEWQKRDEMLRSHNL